MTPGSLIGQPITAALSGEEFLLPGSEEPVLSAPQTVFNLANIVIGVGVLSVPYALKQSGYFALLLFLVVLSITAKTGKWLGSCLELAASTALAAELPATAWDFGFLAEVAFGPKAGAFISAVTVAEVWFALVSFMAMNVQNAEVLWPSSSSVSIICVSGALSMLTCFVPRRAFSLLSFVATLAMLVAALALVRCTYMLSQWAEPYNHLGEAALFRPENIPRSVGIILFCFAGHPCFPAVRTGMRQPEKWDLCIDLSFIVALIYYCSFGALGYIVFGGHLSQIVTQNLVGIRGVQRSRDLAAACFLLKIQLTMPMLLNAVMVALWKPEAGRSPWPLPRVLLLLFISTMTMLAAYASAHAVAVVASLTGSLLIMVTSVLFPAVVHLALRRSQGGGVAAKEDAGGLSILEYLAHFSILVFGVIFAVSGTTLAIRDFLGY